MGKAFVVVILVVCMAIIGISWRNYNLSQDFRMYFGQELPLTPDARATVEPAVTRELFKARSALEQSDRYNHAKLGGKFYDMCKTAQRAGFEKDFGAADCP